MACLQERGLIVWFDDAEFQVGDRLTQKIDDGLRRSQFGVVVLSEAFFRKNWPQAELDALANRENASGEIVILPVWLDIDAEEVRNRSPLLAGKYALRSEEGIDVVADKLVKRVLGTAVVVEPTGSEPARLQPELLQGRVLPHSHSPIVQSDDHALVSRAAIAVRAPTAPEPMLRSATQTAYQEALAGSMAESFLRELTEPLPHRHFDDEWYLVEPTKSWVITAVRGGVKLVVDGWTVDARSSILLRPGMGTGPFGWMIVHLDIAIRPVVPVAAPEANERIPLSFDDLVKLLYVPVTTLIDKIAPSVLPAITGDEPELLAVDTLLLPCGDLLSRYLRLQSHASGRIADATDPHAIVWEPTTLAEVATPEARAAAVRGQIESLFLDGGYRGFEAALERIEPPTLPPITHV